MYAVRDWTAATLLDTTHACIISDMWASWIEKVIGMSYFHQTGNHTESFVGPTTGAHIQSTKFFCQVYNMQNERQL